MRFIQVSETVELGAMPEDTIMTYFKVLFQNPLEGLRKQKIPA
jgi:hypothetical protein